MNVVAPLVHHEHPARAWPRGWPATCAGGLPALTADTTTAFGPPGFAALTARFNPDPAAATS